MAKLNRLKNAEGWVLHTEDRDYYIGIGKYLPDKFDGAKVDPVNEEHDKLSQ